MVFIWRPSNIPCTYTLEDCCRILENIWSSSHPCQDWWCLLHPASLPSQCTQHVQKDFPSIVYSGLSIHYITWEKCRNMIANIKRPQVHDYSIFSGFCSLITHVNMVVHVLCTGFSEIALDSMRGTCTRVPKTHNYYTHLLTTQFWLNYNYWYT